MLSGRQSPRLLSRAPILPLLKPVLQLGLPHCPGPSSTPTPSHPWSPKAMSGFVDVGRLASTSGVPESRLRNGYMGPEHSKQRSRSAKTLKREDAVHSRDTERPRGWSEVSVLASESGLLEPPLSDKIKILQAEGNDSEVSN